MATPTHTLIHQTTLSSSASTVSIGSINSLYRDLYFVANGSVTTGDTAITMRLNGDSSQVYSFLRFSAQGNTYSSGSGTFNEFYPADRANWYSGYTSNISIHFLEANQSNKQKIGLVRNISAPGSTTGATEAMVLRYGSTTRIYQIDISTENPAEPFASGTTFKLYGIVG